MPPKKLKKEPLFLPGTSSSKGNPYIDDEAIESDDDEGPEHYTAEDLAFIDDDDDDDDEMPAEAKRPPVRQSKGALVNPLQKTSTRSSQSSDLVLEEYIPGASASKRIEISSDEFDGIETVEDELNELHDDKNMKPRPVTAGLTVPHNHYSDNEDYHKQLEARSPSRTPSRSVDDEYHHDAFQVSEASCESVDVATQLTSGQSQGSPTWEFPRSVENDDAYTRDAQPYPGAPGPSRYDQKTAPMDYEDDASSYDDVPRCK